MSAIVGKLPGADGAQMPLSRPRLHSIAVQAIEITAPLVQIYHVVPGKQ
jgi:hypothetical protein